MTGKSAMITDIDFDRLTQLIDSPRFRRTHATLLLRLRQELDQGKVVAPDEVPRGTVTMNSRVRVRDLRRGETETYTIVYPDDADIELGRMSVLAPLGTALLGARKGDVVKFEVPAGVRRLEVEKIIYQPEAAGDFHL
jgi:regulator of nucleoside diphosphate kinase